MSSLKNQRGFAAFEILILVILLGVLGFVGYRAYQSRQATSSDIKTTETKRKSVKAVIPAGWKQYSAFKDTGYDLTFAYPKEWKFSLGGKELTDASGKKYTTTALLYIASPDFKTRTVMPGRDEVTSGSEFSFEATGNSHKEEVNDEYMSHWKQGVESLGGKYGQFMVEGRYKGAWRQPSDTHSEGYYVEIFTKQHVYRLNFSLPNNDKKVQEFRATFDKFLKTLKISNPEKLT